MNRQLLDPVSIPAILVGFTILMIVAYEVGFRAGRWWQRRTPGEDEGPTGVLVGSLLALMAFLLGITMSMAGDRFDTRRGLVLTEANAIYTAFLRAGYLPQPQGEEIQDLLRAYVPLRIATADPVQLEANIQASLAIHAESWAIAEELVRTTDNNDLLALAVEGLNDVIELHETRVAAGVYARVPETILLLLLGGSTLMVGMVGYSAGMTGRRSLVSALVLVVVLSAVTLLVVDLDRPRDGFLTVSQQPLLDVQERMGPPD